MHLIVWVNNIKISLIFMFYALYTSLYVILHDNSQTLLRLTPLAYHLFRNNTELVLILCLFTV